VRAQRSNQHRHRGLRPAIAIAALSLLPLAFVTACVDGTTPDCSDAATGCGPDLDGSIDRTEAQPLPEARPADSPVDNAVPDAGDPDADAGDEI
jgi:hypothetical protein